MQNKLRNTDQNVEIIVTHKSNMYLFIILTLHQTAKVYYRS